ncbi:hypothetical protein J7E97_04280 [Streptomyces sp. ISL-66]|uniref:hypothetical protein n=1 Tax=Streptomyces sp. ISL-66 TaxID=2819186 RepID=UPI001BE62A50|nr:hypothetical protein [Streptomyces sp. ISL-66]MBT2467110.1 hypothetical protein [Streptomyces sp. ISL-66]
MRRGLAHAGAWTLATGAAVTLSWWGVHTVMSGTAYDPPLAVPLTTQSLSSSTHRAQPPDPSPDESSPSAPPSPSAPAPSGPGSPSAARSPSASASASAPQPYGKGSGSEVVKSYTVSGGRVVFDLHASTADLVSATPSAGWRMQVWKQEKWIRVTFTRDGREVSVFCTWHDHPPLVEIVDP